jgi:hypothetical protein
MGADSVYDLTERILNPRSAKKDVSEDDIPTSPPMSRPSWESEPPKQEVSRARAIFDASEQAKPFSLNDFDFAMNDENELPEIPAVPKPAEKMSAAKAASPKRKRLLGMEVWQLAVVAALGVCLLALVGGLVYVFLFAS